MVGEDEARIVQRHLPFEGGLAYGIDQLLEPPDLGARCDRFEPQPLQMVRKATGHRFMAGAQPTCPLLSIHLTLQCWPPSPPEDLQHLWAGATLSSGLTGAGKGLEAELRVGVEAGHPQSSSGCGLTPFDPGKPSGLLASLLQVLDNSTAFLHNA